MAQQTFSGVPAAFAAGAVLTAAEQELIRDFLIATIKEGMTGDTGEILPMIMDLTNNRIVLDTGGLEFSIGSTQTVAASAIGFSGTTANGMLNYSSASTIATQSTATYASNTLTLTGAGGGVKMDGLNSSDANTLDDYEEGTWTAALSATTSGSITIDATNDTGGYIKIGKLVYIALHCAVSAISSPVGTLRVTGLPFTSASTGMPELSDYAFNLGSIVNLASAAPGDIVTQLHPNGTYFDINAGGGATSVTVIANLIDTGTHFYISGVYRADT